MNSKLKPLASGIKYSVAVTVSAFANVYKMAIYQSYIQKDIHIHAVFVVLPETEEKAGLTQPLFFSNVCLVNKVLVDGDTLATLHQLSTRGSPEFKKIHTNC